MRSSSSGSYASKRRRGGGRRNPILSKLALYFNPSVQYSVTIISAIALAGFLFSGYLLFQYADSEDLLARGKRLMREGKVALAAKTFQTLVYKYRDSYEGHLLLGKAYLELDERKKAEQEFLAAASLKTKNHSDSAADIAMSKLAMAKQEFPKAEDMLLKAYGKAKKGLGPNNVAKSDEQYRDIMELRQSLFELYEQWGNRLADDEKEAGTHKLYPAIIDKYERALRYANNYHDEDGLKEKLIENYNYFAGHLTEKRQDEQAVVLMKKSLRYRYLPETLIEVASAYERMGKLDEAIDWYRKAFDANPSTISIRLTNVLIKKGRLLLDEKKPEEAQRFFDEAEQVSKQANLPLDVLYPVKISEVQIISDLDDETGEFKPKVKIKLENNGERPLNFLLTRVQILSGDEEIASMLQPVATPDEPLLAPGQKADAEQSSESRSSFRRRKKNSSGDEELGVVSKSGNKLTVVVAPEDALNVHMFKRSQFKVVVSIAYSEGADQQWKVKAIQEATIRQSSPQPVAQGPSA